MHAIDDEVRSMQLCQTAGSGPYQLSYKRAVFPQHLQVKSKAEHQVAYLSLTIPSHVLCHAVSVRPVHGDNVDDIAKVRNKSKVHVPIVEMRFSRF
jgi:hypothetical protein